MTHGLSSPYSGENEVQNCTYVPCDTVTSHVHLSSFSCGVRDVVSLTVDLCATIYCVVGYWCLSRCWNTFSGEPPVTLMGANVLRIRCGPHRFCHTQLFSSSKEFREELVRTGFQPRMCCAPCRCSENVFSLSEDKYVLSYWLRAEFLRSWS
jgi:hypothetical protein